MTDTASTESMYAEQLEQLRQLQMLASLSRRVAALDSLEAVIDTLLQAAIHEIAADRGSVVLAALPGGLLSSPWLCTPPGNSPLSVKGAVAAASLVDLVSSEGRRGR